MHSVIKSCLIVLLLFITFSHESKGQSDSVRVNYEFGAGAGFYDYAPSAIQDEYGIRYLFVCQNMNPFEVIDHIYLYKGIPTITGYKWQPGTMILSPSKRGWDKIHVCDPDVRRFDLIYKGQKYHWIMTYLGVDQWHNHNQIGLAFSKNIEGPYVKYDKNPLIEFTDTTKWGVGQSTSIVLDSATIRLFYSKSGESGGVMCVSDIEMNLLDSIVIGKEQIVPFLYPNTYFSYSRNNVYAVSEIRINESKEIPTWVGNYIRLVYKSRSNSLFARENNWKGIGLIGPKQTGFPRNHNPGLLTDSKGYMLNDNKAIVYFTTAVTGSDWLWSYDMYTAKFELR